MRLPLLVVLCASLAFAADRPRLAVLIVIDQLGSSTFDQRVPLATAGIRRMIGEGTWVKQLRYETAPTVTSVGHATLVTGTYPDRHGIVSNEWYDDALGRKTLSTEDDRYQILGRPPVARDCTSPWLMKMPTLGDTFKAWRKESKTVAISGKERSAILPAGYSADAVVWLDHQSGLFTTSTFYAKEMPAFLAGPNTLIAKSIASGTQFTFAGGGFNARKRTIERHHLPDGGLEPMNEKFELQPLYEHAEVDAALAAVKAYGLGRDEAPDFLSLSFSSHDFLAHDVGPDDPEMEDDFRRIDIQIGRLLDGLDKEVGKGKYVVALTSDHGGGQNAELLKERRIDSGRIDGWVTVRNALEAEADAALGAGDWFVGFWTPGVSSTAAVRTRLHTADARIIAAGRKIPGVAEVISMPELNKPGTYGALGDLYRHGAFPGRSPDFIIVPRPYWMYGTRDSASHGTPWLFDRNVPLVLFGGGVRKGEIELAEPVDVAPTLAALVGAPPPPATTGRVLVPIR